ncbi:hypothetical protein NL676_038609 [Syzygium grande]|nr:hypothetical protein NL676_038609 [Syzygium grande]
MATPTHPKRASLPPMQTPQPLAQQPLPGRSPQAPSAFDPPGHYPHLATPFPTGLHSLPTSEPGWDYPSCRLQ